MKRDLELELYGVEDLEGKLIIIGKGYHCPYCRGYRFTLKPVDGFAPKVCFAPKVGILHLKYLFKP